MIENIYIRALRDICEKWGGELVACAKIPKGFDAPFSHFVGCDWENGKVFYDEEREDNNDTLGGIIHEMAHTFGTTKRPADIIDEIEDLLGWEWGLAQKIGVSIEGFIRMSRDYALDEGDLGDLGEGEAKAFVYTLARPPLPCRTF